MGVGGIFHVTTVGFAHEAGEVGGDAIGKADDLSVGRSGVHLNFKAFR
jgi:hypothetical protein